MGILDLFKSESPVSVQHKNSVFFKAGVPIGNPASTSPRGSYNASGRYNNRRSESMVFLHAYKKSPWIKPCVDKRCTSGSKDWRLNWKNKPAKPTPIDPVAALPIFEFLNNPNDKDTWSSLSAKMQRDMIVQGSVIMEVRRLSFDESKLKLSISKAFEAKLEEINESLLQKGFMTVSTGIDSYTQEVEDVVGEIVAQEGIPVWLKVLPFEQMEVVIDKQGNILKYLQWTQEGETIEFAKEEIIQIFSPMSIDEKYGDSELLPLVVVADTDMLIDSRQNKMLRGDISFNSLFTLPETATQDDADRVWAELDTVYRKTNNEAAFFVSTGDVKYTNVAQNKDGDFLKQSMDNRNTILMHLGVPFSVLGDTSGTSSSYAAGSDNALRNFLENTVRPYTNHIEHTLNREIMAPYHAQGLDYIIEYVLEDADDSLALEEQYNIAVNNGTMTRNEKRLKMGMDPDKNGDVLTVGTSNSQVMTLDQILNPPAPLPPPAAPKEPAKEDPNVNKAISDLRSAVKILRKSI